MNSFDNERIEIAEMYGAVAGDLHGAFAEFAAVSVGTKAKECLYSLSISPSAPLTREQYFEAIGIIETRLGLTGQPRAVIFHVKRDKDHRAREHCHVVWSRIDVDKMRAVHMAHDHRKLMNLACELARKYGLKLPPGLAAWEKRQKLEKEKLEPTLGEKAQAEETGITPEQRREEITAAYEASDSAEAFRSALEQKGYVLARGDKRGMVVVDRFGGVHSLTRYIKGHTAKQIKAKLAALMQEQLPSVDQAKELMRQRARAQEEREREQQQDEQRDLSAEALAKAERLAEFRRQAEEGLAEKQAARRLEVRQAKQQLFTRQQAERLALHAAQKSESRRFLFRVRSAVADLIGRTPGLRSVLSHIQKKTHLDPKERHALENEALARRHAREKRDIERRRRTLARLEARETQSLEKAVRREQRLQEAARLERERTAEQARTVENMAKQDFFDAARDQGLWKQTDIDEGELSRTFNDEAGFVQGPPDSGDDDDGLAPDWKAGADDNGGDDDNGGPRHRGGAARAMGIGEIRTSLENS
jgi:hypothetical protein